MDGQTEIPKSTAETTEANRYESLARALILEAKEMSPADRLFLMRTFVDNVVADAAMGKIVNGDGTAQYAPEDIENRMEAFREIMNNPDQSIHLDAIKEIPRSGQLRSAFLALSSEESTSGALLEILRQKNLEEAQEDLGEAAASEVVTNASDFDELVVERAKGVVIPDTEAILSGDVASGSAYDELFRADYKAPTGTDAAAIRPPKTADELANEARAEADYKNAFSKASNRPEMQ
jgi:hypothetical protein